MDQTPPIPLPSPEPTENELPTPETRGRETRGRAIRRMCIECMGGGTDGDPMRGPHGVIACIRECPSSACPLWAHRPYRNAISETNQPT